MDAAIAGMIPALRDKVGGRRSPSRSRGARFHRIPLSREPRQEGQGSGTLAVRGIPFTSGAPLVADGDALDDKGTWRAVERLPGQTAERKPGGKAMAAQKNNTSWFTIVATIDREVSMRYYAGVDLHSASTIPSFQHPNSTPRLYTELAEWWPLLSPPDTYATEAAAFLACLRTACRSR